MRRIQLRGLAGGRRVCCLEPNRLVLGWLERERWSADFTFTAADLNTGNIVEAGVDGVVLSNTATGVICSGIFSDGFESGDISAWN